MKYLVTYKTHNIMSWEEQTHEEVVDTRQEADAIVYIGKKTNGEFDHEIMKIEDSVADFIKLRQKMSMEEAMRKLKELSKSS